MFASKSKVNRCGCDKQQEPMTGGSVFLNEDDINTYKAFKYHMKNRRVVKALLAQGKTVPSEYLQFLKPFNEN